MIIDTWNYVTLHGKLRRLVAGRADTAEVVALQKKVVVVCACCCVLSGSKRADLHLGYVRNLCDLPIAANAAVAGPLSAGATGALGLVSSAVGAYLIYPPAPKPAGK